MSMEGTGVRAESTDATPRETADTDDFTVLSADAGARTLAHFAHPRADTETALAIVSDPHVSTGKEGTWKVFHRTEERLRAALADATAREVDGVVFAGDLTEDGRPEDFAGVTDLLGDLRIPAVAVPGNHDVPKSFKAHETPPLSTFEDRFTPGELPFRAAFGGVDVLGLDSASAPDGSLDATHAGSISAAQREWLDAALAESDAALVVTHHNLPGLGDCFGDESAVPHPPVEGAAAFARTLARHDALHVSGHVHLPAVTRCEGATGVVCPALSSFPQAYTLLEVGPDGTTLSLVPVADSEGVAEAHELARTHSARSRTVSEVVADQLSDLPLADERDR
ncbi:metallophosphoesterase family protein [Halorussus amylolyticus]|uniref:metallophosphoesterase family protein n=1 Tax=Halorussus amylolyticus TaxID=1126242 RepID=UPI00138F1A4E|nr:metallophosphoesterase [Halorussus amylolyticus]